MLVAQITKRTEDNHTSLHSQGGAKHYSFTKEASTTKYVVPEQAKVILKLQSETKKETKERN
jgi:hypothetical protein